MNAWRILLALVLAPACDPSADDPAFRRADEADDPAAGVVPRPDPQGSKFICDPATQAVGRTDKGTHWANDGSVVYNSTRAAPVDPDPVGIGEPCVVEGFLTSGHDNCQRGSMCWYLDETGAGTCHELCVGATGVHVSCPDPDDQCLALSSGISICLPACDPVDPTTCADGLGCYVFDDGAVCIPDFPAEPGQAGAPCEHPVGCDRGLLCAEAAAVPDCGGAIGCCTPACDLTAPSCADGLVCTPYYDDNVPASRRWDDVGVCTLP